ncbi:copper type II ascorbate-dependent monooxygenase domain protein [Dictyocaulus viviparus]|uniref:peptidylglycine monooxygenase n=1 Tax=Dictyocaulus viviparus TaxID=29172 RepID=A0A0D8Y3J2_DICVI|nr:copper type II ascorbate-dependent monooxygenase domain protein [Dictyocaulus viviparus]
MAETYACTSVQLDPESETYLIGYKANVESHNAHHILLFGCDEPGSYDEVWDCGEMATDLDGLNRAPTCKSNPAILYAWAKNAPELNLPKGVGFRVGGDSGINFLVMQVHYMEERDKPDYSGVTLHHTQEVQPKTAATMLLVTGGILPPKSTGKFVEDCGEMETDLDGLNRAPTCKSNPAILYAWAKNAPELNLPKGVGFRVGGDSGINFLVMQVHYMEERDKPDYSGVTLHHTQEVQPKTAATMLLVTGGILPPKSTESFETACMIQEDVVLHPFAFRTHSHRHGVDISGWNEKGDDKWTLIGRRDPQLPQMFVPVQNKSLVIHQGDIIAARCILKNDENRVIMMGATGEDEMCNFYMMYWTDSDRVMTDNTCFSMGAPFYRWSSEAGLNHIPK